MKNIITLSLVILFVISCKKEGKTSIDEILKSKDVVSLKKYKDGLEVQKQELTNQIKTLVEKIEVLEPNLNIPLVTVYKTVEVPFMHYIELQGSVKTKKNILVYPEVPGIITGIYVKAGQHVKKGQIIARIDNGGLSNQLAQAEIGTGLAKTMYERQKRLWDQKIGSEIQYLQAKTSYESQTNVVKQLQKSLQKYVVTAPFSGIVDNVMKETGALVAPGRGGEICRVVNLSNMYIDTDVPESYISVVTKGKKVEVNFPVLGESVTSKVRQAASFINPANRTFKIEVFVPNKNSNIKPNLTAKLKVNDYTNNKAILIPQSVISENENGEQYVYTTNKLSGKKATVKQVIVKTGKSKDDTIEILEGLTSGMQVIQEGARAVKDGQEVEISNFSIK